MYIIIFLFFWFPLFIFIFLFCTAWPTTRHLLPVTRYLPPVYPLPATRPPATRHPSPAEKSYRQSSTQPHFLDPQWSTVTPYDVCK